MMKRIAVIFAAAVLAASCRLGSTSDTGISIIPMPVSMTEGEGCFDLRSAVLSDCSGEAASVADFFTDKFRKASGISLRCGDNANVALIIDPECGLPVEGYKLDVTTGGIRAVGADAAGLFYAVQTIFQLLPPEIDSPERVCGGRWTVPAVSITDYPRFKWRGVHVDPCRHFMEFEDIKKHVDIYAEYKINVLHLHLTDDQGWRIEIRKYPRLTEIGGWRTEFDGSVHGGFYTQDQMRELVAYCAERHITVLPEIEMPGHAIALVRAYPELSCSKQPIGTFYTWGTTDKVFCPGDEKTFEFLEDVVSELVPIFPCEYFHIGGDECIKTEWEKCPACQARIAAEGFCDDDEFTAEEKLQSYAVARMEKILDKYGRKLVGWDEILEGGLSRNATVMSWRGEKGGIAAARMGHDVIMTPSHEGMYLDSYQGDSKCEPLAFGRNITLEKIYDYNPVPEALADCPEHVLGAQGNVWSEYLYDIRQREYMIFPRVLALAELTWTPLERKDFTDFARRADAAAKRLDYHGVNYHIPLPEQPGGSCSNLAFTDSISVEFTTSRPEKMVYTLNGRTPGRRSTVYSEPLRFTDDAVIKIRTVLPGGQMSQVRTIFVRKQSLLPATRLDNPVHGLKMSKTYGEFIRVEDLDAAFEWETLTLTDLRELTSQEERPRDMQNVKFYGAVAEGYVRIPKDGVWRFSTDNDQLWIDGNLVVDNNGLVKRYSRGDSEIALAEGFHSIRIIFLSNVIGGWTSSRNKGEVSMRLQGDDSFHRLKSSALYLPQ